MRRALWSVFAVVLGAALFVHGATASAAPPTPDETALLEHYAPVLALRHQATACGEGEPYHPVAVDAILGRSDVVLRDSSGTVTVTAPTAADLAAAPADRWIDLPGATLDPGCDYERWFDSLGAPPAIYGRLTSQDGHLVAQYWFFYVYNDWNDVHEGDWEMVQLDFGPVSLAEALASGPRTYAYAQHEGSEYATVGDAKLVRDGDHPVVYVAEGSHASFFSSSRWFGKSAATGFGCDDTSSPVDRISPQVIALPGDDVPTTGDFAWLAYLGHWGEKAPTFNNGPTGPVTKTQWSTPVSWVADEGRDSAVALPFASSSATETFCSLSAKGSQLFIRLLHRPWLVLTGLALAIVAVVLVVRRSSQGVLTRAWRAWRADRRRLLRIGTVVLVAAAAASVVQWFLLTFTRLGTLVDTVGDSSAWVLPLVAVIGSVAAVPIMCVAAAATVDATVGPPRERPVSDVVTRRRSIAWATIALVVLVEVAVLVFLPLAILASRWLVAPVAATSGSARTALGASNRMVRGHAWRALGMLVTLVLVAALAGVVGALVLLLAPWPFWAASVAVAIAGMFLVPYVALAVVEFHRDLHPVTADPEVG